MPIFRRLLFSPASFLKRLGLAACALMPMAEGMAADITWTGGGADNNWSTGLNWGGVAPVAGDSLSFGGAVRLAPVNNFTADTSFAGFTFLSGAGAFTLSGNRITLGGSITNSSTNAQTLSLDMILDATRTVDAATGNITLSGLLSGNGGLLKTGSGQLTLSGSTANTYTGTTAVSGGTLRLDKSANNINAIAGNLDITSGGMVTFNRSGIIADTATVTVSGATSVFNGTAANTGVFSSLTETIAGLTMTGGVFNTGNAVWTITGAGSFTGGAENTNFLGNSGTRVSFGSLSISNMAATAGSNVAAANTFTLYGNSTSQISTVTVGSGGLSLDGGRINLRRGSTGALGSRLILNGDVTTSGSAASFITEDTNGGTTGMLRLELSGLAAPVDRVFNTGNTLANLTVGVEIANGSSSNAGVIKNGAGTLTFTGALANTYTGLTTINAGILALNKTAGVNAVGGDIVVNAGGTLTMSANEQIPNTAGITMEGGTISAWNRTETIAYYTQNSGGVTSSGNSGQVTITGTMTLAGGTTFTLNSSSTPAHFQANALVMTGANIIVGGNNGTGAGRTALTVGSGGLSMTGRTITLYRGSGGTVLNLNGNFTGNGSSGILVEVDGAVEPELNLGADTRTFDIVTGTTNISVGIVGTAGLTKTGAGILTFTGALNNTYSGTTTVSGGTLSLNRTAGVNAIAGPLTIATGGTLTLNADEQIADTVAVTVSGGALSGLTRTETIASYTQTAGGLALAGNTGSLNVTGLVTLSGGNTMTINSSISPTPPAWNFGGAVLSGADILLGGNNGSANPKTRLTIGSLGLTLNGRNLTANGGDSGVEVYLNGDVTATGTSAITLGSGGAVNPILYLGTGTRTFQITSGTTTLGMTVADSAALQKAGSGVLVLALPNTYSGGTIVTAGMLRVSNATGSATGTGAVTINSGATLNGAGRVAPASGQGITVNGALSIGNSGASSGEALTLITSGAGTIQLNGTVSLDLFSGQGSGGINGATAADRLVLGSAAQILLGGSSVLNVTTSIPINAGNTAGWTAGTSWQIIDWTGLTGSRSGSFSNLTGTQGNFLNLPNLSSMGFTWDVSSLYTSGTITVVAIPEPGRLLLLILGLSALLMRRRIAR